MFALVLCLAGLATLPQTRHLKTRQITHAEIAALVQAVQDEIYDYGFEDDYYRLGPNVGSDPKKWTSRVPIYVNPLIEDGEGYAIYKHMHYGEVYRLFTLRKDGVVVLDGDPELSFPPTQTSVLTIYMDDDEVMRMKRDWLRSYFEIDSPINEWTVRAAAQRQKGRTGFSYWETAILPNLKKQHTP